MNRDRHRASGRSRSDDVRVERDRIRIAQTAARLIAEHGLADWSLAKRKAARQLMLPEGAGLPSNEEIEEALAAYHALFGGAAHAASLRAQRSEALAWMTRLAAWEPLLVGGVAAGWATQHGDVRLELCANDPKDVEMALAGAGIRYGAITPRADPAAKSQGAQLFIATPRAGIRLSILSTEQRRNRPRRDGEPRLPAEAVAAMLAADQG